MKPSFLRAPRVPILQQTAAKHGINLIAQATMFAGKQNKETLFY